MVWPKGLKLSHSYFKFCCGVEKWYLVGLISRRSRVRLSPPQPVSKQPTFGGTKGELMTMPKSVLIIDDCVDILELTKMILELAGFKVATAVSGRDGLRVLLDMEQPDLILVDNMMDDMGGAEFLETLESARPITFKNVPVVFFSGSDFVPPKAAGKIGKPFDMKGLVKDVNHFIDAR